MIQNPNCKRLVIIESPYKGDVQENIAYAKRAVLDCLNRGEAPIASHLLFTQPGILDDAVKEDRRLGISAGRAWMHVADAVVVYNDLGISEGMVGSVCLAKDLGIPVEYRSIIPGSKLND